MKWSVHVGLVCGISTVGCSRPSETSAHRRITVLHGGTLIDGTGSVPIPNSVIVLEDHRILRVGQVGDFQYPDGASLQDLSGRFVIPGLIDMHVHVPPTAESETLKMLLAFGITTIRSPGSPPEQGLELRKRVASQELIGPRMFVAGRVLTPVKEFPGDVAVSNAAEIRAEVRRQAEAGVDYIKLSQAPGPGSSQSHHALHGIEQLH